MPQLPDNPLPTTVTDSYCITVPTCEKVQATYNTRLVSESHSRGLARLLTSLSHMCKIIHIRQIDLRFRIS